jgi:hypothetical protein
MQKTAEIPGSFFPVTPFLIVANPPTKPRVMDVNPLG